MKWEMFAVYDSKARCFFAPFTSQSVATARRAFAAAVNAAHDHGATMIQQHPEDFTLFRVGSFDDDTGVMTAMQPPENHGLAANYKIVRLVDDVAERTTAEALRERFDGESA